LVVAWDGFFGEEELGCGFCIFGAKYPEEFPLFVEIFELLVKGCDEFSGLA